MSNHGKESTNEEGVNIDETQTKIDMGKLITPSWDFDCGLASQLGIHCAHAS
jgi:hypothetical protein